jgi:hypothetical protein
LLVFVSYSALLTANFVLFILSLLQNITQIMSRLPINSQRESANRFNTNPAYKRPTNSDLQMNRYKLEKRANSYMLGSTLESSETETMNRENYKSIRNKPKRNSAVSRIKKQMLIQPKASSPASDKKMRETYSRKTEWMTAVIPKLREK